MTRSSNWRFLIFNKFELSSSFTKIAKLPFNKNTKFYEFGTWPRGVGEADVLELDVTEEAVVRDTFSTGRSEKLIMNCVSQKFGLSTYA